MARFLVREMMLAVCLTFGGCAVGPDYTPPFLSGSAGFLPSGSLPTRTAASPVALGSSQHFAPAADIPPDWWTLFHSRNLNGLIEAAIAANPTLEAAEANLRVAIANVRAQQGALFPTVATNFNTSRNRTPTGSLSPTTASGASIFTLFTAQATVNYTLDVFGGVRRSIEALGAQVDVQYYQTRATYLTLVANVANAAILEASTREQIEATQEIIRLQKESLALLRIQGEKGQTAGLDAVAQETALAQSELTLPPLQKQLVQTRNLLAALMGNFPNAPPLQIFRLSDLHLPRNLPVSLPSELVRRRPDVQAADAMVHSASALIGVAIANRLPNFTLTADYGASSVQWASLLAGGNRFWSYAGNVAQTVFDGGTLRERQKAAEAAFEAAKAGYRATVLSAFQNVADALQALKYDAVALTSAARAYRLSSEYLSITRKKVELGAVNILSLIAAQQAYQQARIALIQAQAARLTDTVALFQALGGGWWSEAPSPKLVSSEMHPG